jgi:hypothetical protein
MKYSKLIEFCEFILATRADETDLADHHVKVDGYIETAWSRVLDAIHRQEDFDIKTYMQSLIDSALENTSKKFLN